MINATLRFLEFMDARPLPGAETHFRLEVVPRFVEFIGGRSDEPAVDEPLREPPLSMRLGVDGPATKPRRVLIPARGLGESLTITRTTAEDGRATAKFEVEELFERLSEARREGQRPVDVVAQLHVGLFFMGFVREERELGELLTSPSASVHHDVAVDFGMAAVGHTRADATRLWFALADAPREGQSFRCVVAPAPSGAATRAPLSPLDPGASEPVHDDEVQPQRIDQTALVDVEGLEAGEAYQYELRVDHEGRSFAVLLGRVETPSPAEQDRLRVSFGSCHRPSVPLDLDQARTAADDRLDRWQHLAGRDDDDLMLLVGDQIYGDGLENKWPEQHWLERYQRRYRQLWAYWPMREVLRRVPVYMILDDHEVRDDFGTAELDSIREAAALEVYRSFQHARNPGGPEGPLHYSFRRGPAAFFVTDGRSQRQPGRPGILGHDQLEDMRAWAASPSTREADVIVVVATVPPALLPTELIRKIAHEAAEDVGSTLGASVGALVGAGFGGLVGGPAGAVLGGAVLGAIGHELGEEIVEHERPDIDRSLLLEVDLADRWDLAGNQSELVEVLDLLFDLANGVGEDPPRRRAVFLLSGDIHTGTMHLIRSLPVRGGRRHRANPVLMQLTSSAISHPPVDQAGYRELVSRIDDDFDIGLKDFSASELWQIASDFEDSEDTLVDKLDELLERSPAAYTLDSAGERRYRAEYAGLLMDHNVGRLEIQRVGPGRRYRFQMAIEGRSDSLTQEIEMDLESEAEEVPRFSLHDRGATRIYLRVRRERADGGSEPFAGVRVQVMDQDAPAPARDDARPPEEDRTVVGTDKVQTVTTRSFEPPDADEALAEGRTDRFGALWLKLSPRERRTTAGVVTTTTSTTKMGNFPNGPGGPGGHGRPGDPVGPIPRPSGASQTQRHTTERPLPERRPDLYFLLHLPDGRMIDTRELDRGFFPNVRGGSLGSAEEPMEFRVALPEDRPRPEPAEPPRADEPADEGSGGPGGAPEIPDLPDPEDSPEEPELPNLPPKVIIDRPRIERPRIEPRPHDPGFPPF